MVVPRFLHGPRNVSSPRWSQTRGTIGHRDRSHVREDEWWVLIKGILDSEISGQVESLDLMHGQFRYRNRACATTVVRATNSVSVCPGGVCMQIKDYLNDRFEKAPLFNPTLVWFVCWCGISLFRVGCHFKWALDAGQEDLRGGPSDSRVGQGPGGHGGEVECRESGTGSRETNQSGGGPRLASAEHHHHLPLVVVVVVQLGGIINNKLTSFN